MKFTVATNDERVHQHSSSFYNFEEHRFSILALNQVKPLKLKLWFLTYLSIGFAFPSVFGILFPCPSKSAFHYRYNIMSLASSQYIHDFSSGYFTFPPLSHSSFFSPSIDGSLNKFKLCQYFTVKILACHAFVWICKIDLV